MNSIELTALLERLRAEPRETEWLEFKANRYEPQALGEYLSALANAAGLLGKSRAYLVFGVEDRTHAVVGTTFDPAAATGQKARHIRDKGFDNRYYRDLILEIIRTHQPVSREEIDRLLLGKLPEVLTPEQKRAKVHNLLTSLARKSRAIVNTGSRKKPQWVLVPAPANKQ